MRVKDCEPGMYITDGKRLYEVMHEPRFSRNFGIMGGGFYEVAVEDCVSEKRYMLNERPQTTLSLVKEAPVAPDLLEQEEVQI